MGELLVTDSCRRCGVVLAESDNYCRNCGRRNAASADANVETELIDSRHMLASVSASRPSVALRRRQSPLAAVLENRAYVIVILLCAGPIGLPALWLSQRFSPRFKIVTTTVFFLLTVVLPLAFAWYMLDVAVRPLLDALSQSELVVLQSGHAA